MTTARGRHSPQTLAGVLAPLQTEVFRTSFLGRQFLHSAGERGRFAELLPWKDLNGILRRHHLGPPRLRLVREGSGVPSGDYLRYRTSRRAPANPVPQLRVPEFTALLRDGATLIVDSIDELQDPIGQLAADLERTLECRIQVNMYAGWRLSPGFDLHWDDHDVLVLQISGRKHWRVYPMTREHPLRGDRRVPKPDGPPVWDGVLEDGQLLYIPRGWWHVAVPMDEPTLHLTVGLHRATGADLLEWFASRMRESAAVRRDLPRFAAAEERKNHASLLRSEFERLWSERIVDEYLAAMDARAEARPRFALPWAVAPAALFEGETAWTVRWLVPRPLDLTIRKGVIRFVYARKEWTFAPDAAPLLNLLQSMTVCTCDQLCQASPSLKPAVVRAFVKELLSAGLITVDAEG